MQGFDHRIMRIDKACWTADDIWIAQHLASKGIPRIKLPLSADARPAFLKASDVDNLRSSNVFGELKNDRCATNYASVFRRMWLEEPQPCVVQFSPFGVRTSETAYEKMFMLPLPSTLRPHTSPCSQLKPEPAGTGQASVPLAQGFYMRPNRRLPSPKGFSVAFVDHDGNLCSEPATRHGMSVRATRCFPGWRFMAAQPLAVLVGMTMDGMLCAQRGESWVAKSNAQVL